MTVEEAKNWSSMFLAWIKQVKNELAVYKPIIQIQPGEPALPNPYPIQGAKVWLTGFKGVVLVAMSDMTDRGSVTYGGITTTRNDPRYQAYKVLDSLRWFSIFPPSEEPEPAPEKSDI